MKIVAINGSYRGDHGYTRFLIDNLFQGAVAAGADCKVITLAKLKINHCIGCNQCETTKDFLQCIYKEQDDVETIFNEMAQADLIVYATPVYIFGMSALLKIFLERFHSICDSHNMCLTSGGMIFHQVNRAVCSKPFATLICCDNIENETPKNTLSYFRTFSRFMDAPQVGTLIRNSGRLAKYGQSQELDSQFPKIREVYQAYQLAGRELATKGYISKTTQRCANQEIIPVPLFAFLKTIPFKFFKKEFVKRYHQFNKD